MGILFEFFPELGNALTDADHDLRGAVIVEAVAAIRQGDGHGLTETIECLRAPAQFSNRLAKADVFSDAGSFPGQIKERLIVLSAAARQKRDQGRQISAQLDQTLGEHEKRTIERKAVTVPAMLALKSPKGQRIGSGKGHQPSVLGGTIGLDSLGHKRRRSFAIGNTVAQSTYHRVRSREAIAWLRRRFLSSS